jgi:hypothetical protein
MTLPEEPAPASDPGSPEISAGLQEALVRLTSPGREALRSEVRELRERISAILDLEEHLRRLDGRLEGSLAGLVEEQHDVRDQIQNISQALKNLAGDLDQIRGELENHAARQEKHLEVELEVLRDLIQQPEHINSRINPLLTPLIHDRARNDGPAFAEAVAPAVGPAIRHQIRAARQDIIDALYPVIGQIISKAISEAIRELTRRIDTQLRSRFNFASRFRLLYWRMRGLSESELIFREAVPYAIHHVFLIHWESGLLLDHRSTTDSMIQDPDLISGMLTAIRDFVGDSFGLGSQDLEDITYGDERILLEGGQHAYLAVVLEGVEPPGYAHAMREAIHRINLDHEAAIRDYEGDPADLPAFSEVLMPLLAPPTIPEDGPHSGASMSAQEQVFLYNLIIVGLALVALLIFACIFTIRLWPTAFGGP